MSHVKSRWLLVVGAAFVSTSLGHAQDPIPVGYSTHHRQPQWGQPGVNAFTPQPMPIYSYQSGYFGPQMSASPYGTPEGGIRAPFIIPPGAGNPRPHGHGGKLAGLFSGASHGRPVIDNLPTHPYARSPRDFFMFYDNLEAERSRDLRPALVP